MASAQQQSLTLVNSTGGAVEFKQNPTRSTPSRNVGTSRDEMNLAEFPLAVLSTRVDPSVKTLQFKDCQRLKNGEIIEREWLITGADKFGLPTSTDDDVLLGLMRLTMDEGFRDRKVFFTRYELLRILRWTTEGRSYQRLTKSLDRLSGVRIKAANAFYDNNTKSYQTLNFGIIDAYELNGERGSRSTARSDTQQSYFIWSEILFNSFKAGFIKKIDLEFYFTLRTAVSRRLYRYLDKHFYYRPVVEKPVMAFAFEKLGISRNYKFVSSVRQQLEPGLDELVEKGYLRSYEFVGRGAETVLRMSVGRGPEISAHSSSFNHTASPAAETRNPEKRDYLVGALGSIEAMLTQRGIAEHQARRIVERSSDAEKQYILRIIAYVDHLVAKKDQKISKNPAGFLYRAVSNPETFTVPRHFSAVSASRPVLSEPPKRAADMPSGRGAGEREGNEVSLQRYRAYVSDSVRAYRAKMDEPSLLALYAAVERKIAPLKSVLDKSRFSEALEGCVSDELARCAGVPDFRAWLRQN